jgi:hypothetical protein
MDAAAELVACLVTDCGSGRAASVGAAVTDSDKSASEMFTVSGPSAAMADTAGGDAVEAGAAAIEGASAAAC